MNPSRIFVERPVATTLLTLAVAIAGSIAFVVLPVSPLPQVDFPTITVAAQLPGASPDIMASSVATPSGARVRPYLRRHRDDIVEHTRHNQHHDAVRS